MAETGKETEMRGKFEKGIGKVKEEVGEATGERRLEAEGRIEGAKGEVREGVGKAKGELEKKD